jgi:hypothetical protein
LAEINGVNTRQYASILAKEVTVNYSRALGGLGEILSVRNGLLEKE